MICLGERVFAQGSSRDLNIADISPDEVLPPQLLACLRKNSLRDCFGANPIVGIGDDPWIAEPSVPMPRKPDDPICHQITVNGDVPHPEGGGTCTKDTETGRWIYNAELDLDFQEYLIPDPLVDLCSEAICTEDFINRYRFGEGANAAHYMVPYPELCHRVFQSFDAIYGPGSGPDIACSGFGNFTAVAAQYAILCNVSEELCLTSPLDRVLFMRPTIDICNTSPAAPACECPAGRGGARMCNNPNLAKSEEVETPPPNEKDQELETCGDREPGDECTKEEKNENDQEIDASIAEKKNEIAKLDEKGSEELKKMNEAEAEAQAILDRNGIDELGESDHIPGTLIGVDQGIPPLPLEHQLPPEERPAYLEAVTRGQKAQFNFENAGGILHHVAAGFSGCR